MQHTAQLGKSLESAAPPILNRVGIHPLPHSDRSGSPALVGIDSRGQVALEMIYGKDGWLVQYVIAADGTLIAQRDEDYGRNHAFEPLDLSDFSNLLPHLPDAVQDLAFAGGRWRGAGRPAVTRTMRALKRWRRLDSRWVTRATRGMSARSLPARNPAASHNLART